MQLFTGKGRLSIVALVLLNLFLFCPAIYSLGLNRNFENVRDPIVWWNIICSIAFLVTVQLLIRRTLWLHLLLFPFYITVCVDYFIMATYDARLSAGYVWLIFANTDDWLEYLQSDWDKISMLALCFSIFYLSCLWLVQKLTLSPRYSYQLRACAVAAMATLYFGVAARQQMVHQHPTYKQALQEILALDASSPMGTLSQTTVVAESLKQNPEPDARRNFKFNATRSTNTAGSEVYVLVVGESSRTDRWSLFGYERQTNPKLSAQENIVAYRSTASCPITLMAVPIMLTAATVDSFERSQKERSVLSIFNEVGFKSYWHSTQVFGSSAGDIHFITAEADEIRYYKRSLDGVLINGMEGILAKIKENNQKALIVLHTEGSHLKYKNKYPRDFAIFADSDDLDRKQYLGNSYDNTVLYTDHLLSELIDQLRAQNLPSVMMYASDHGENLMDDARGLVGHAYGNKHDMDVPMLLWYSDAYRALYPEKVRLAEHNASAELDAHHLFHSLIDAADIRYKDFNPGFSIFQPNPHETQWSKALQKERFQLCQPARAALRQAHFQSD